MPKPRRKIVIDYSGDSYEFVINENTITRIVKTMSDSNISRELQYDAVPFAVKEELHQILSRS